MADGEPGAARPFGALHFSAHEASRKRRDLARYPRHHGEQPGARSGRRRIREGERQSRAPTRGRSVRRPKHGWPVPVRDGTFYADGALTGPPPYVVYEVTPMPDFGFGAFETSGATRWRF